MSKFYAEDVFEEVDNSTNESGAFKSAHEGYSVLRGAVDELWDEIKAGKNKNRMRAKANKVAATAIRFIRDVC